MDHRWRNHTVLCFGDILAYNNFFDMITHFICPKQAEKGTAEKRGYNDQSIKDQSLTKLEMQQAKLENCLAVSFDIGAVQGSYLNNQKELSNKLDCNGNLTHQGLTSNWNHVQSCLEPCTSKGAWKHTRRNYKRKEDKRFKPPDLNQERHQDVTFFILIKEPSGGLMTLTTLLLERISPITPQQKSRKFLVTANLITFVLKSDVPSKPRPK
ncbi:hypothetical protein Bca4012_092469 [Brassica carinata]